MFRKIDRTNTFNDVLKQIIAQIQTGGIKARRCLACRTYPWSKNWDFQTCPARSAKSSFSSGNHSQRAWRRQLYCNRSKQLPYRPHYPSSFKCITAKFRTPFPFVVLLKPKQPIWLPKTAVS